MDEKDKTGKQELIDIYNNLLPPLKKQILNIAKIVEGTQETLIEEYKNLEIKPNKATK
jgi:hypothetical protein